MIHKTWMLLMLANTPSTNISHGIKNTCQNLCRSEMSVYWDGGRWWWWVPLGLSWAGFVVSWPCLCSIRKKVFSWCIRVTRVSGSNISQPEDHQCYSLFCGWSLQIKRAGKSSIGVLCISKTQISLGQIHNTYTEHEMSCSSSIYPRKNVQKLKYNKIDK